MLSLANVLSVVGETPFFVQALYLVAAVLFIFGIKGLSKVKSARRANRISAVGMLVAIVAALLDANGLGSGIDWTMVAGGFATGAIIGGFLAARVELTSMPELVAAFNGFGGGASVLVALGELNKYMLTHNEGAGVQASTNNPVFAWILPVTLLIGAVTFTGSGVAYFKLSGKKIVHPLPGALRHIFHLALLGVVVWGTWSLATGAVTDAALWQAAIVVAGVAGLLGIFLVIPIGGADMPVVVSLLNSYSGMAAAAAGFLLNNYALIVCGSLVGASGLILTAIMCKAMNRSLGNVLLGGISDDAMADDAREYGTVKETSGEELAMLMESVSDVIVVPGYGMAVSQAHHVVREIADFLEEQGARVRYAIHPVAGRMPGHMNVLLAEANVPYDRLCTMEEINSDFSQTELVLMVGANDIANPDAIDIPDGPIGGMPVLHVWEAQTCVVVKRSLSPGYAGVRNPLFDADKTLMLFGDGKAALQSCLDELKEM